MTKNENLPYWLALSYLPDVGPRRGRQWLRYFSNVGALFEAPTEQLKACGIAEKYRVAIKNPDWRAIEQDIKWAGQSGQSIIVFEDEDYPALLKEIDAPPLVLYVQGNKSVLQKLQLAIVGSRHATPTGMKNAEQFAYSLADAGLGITSGLALGIDGASHRGALLAKGVTIGVAGTGLQYIYPRSHKKLYEEITTHGGAIISEFPLSMQPLAQNFPRRNRVISGLSTGVLVVEAALKSGSLITAHYALEAGREVFAIPGSIHHPLSRGCHHLIKEGAKLVETAADILEELKAFATLPLAISKEVNDKEKLGLSPSCRLLFDLIGYEISSIDMLLLRSRLTASEVSSNLLTLELKGYIKSVSGGYIRT